MKRVSGLKMRKGGGEQPHLKQNVKANQGKRGTLRVRQGILKAADEEGKSIWVWLQSENNSEEGGWALYCDGNPGGTRLSGNNPSEERWPGS